MAHDVQLHVKSKAEYEYARKRSAMAMRNQVTTFAIMILLTLVAFTAVQAGFSAYFVVPVILLLAGIQVALQLYYFMHMSEKGHETISLFMYTGVFIAFTFILAFTTVVWI